MKENWNPFLLLTAHPRQRFSDFRGCKEARNPSAYVITQMNSSLRPAFKCPWIQLLISWYWYNMIFIHWYHFISHTCWYFLEYIWTGPQVEDSFSLNLVCLDPESFSNPAAVWWNCQAVWWNARHSGVGSWGLRSNCERNPYYWKYMFLKKVTATGQGDMQSKLCSYAWLIHICEPTRHANTDFADMPLVILKSANEVCLAGKVLWRACIFSTLSNWS